MNRVICSIVIGLLTNQMEGWRNNRVLRVPFKILLLAFFSSQVFALGNLFKSLPEGFFQQLLNNLNEPIVLICSVIICIFWIALTCYTVAVGKLMKTLIG